MYLAFTKELCWNQYATATSQTDAIERLRTEVKRWFDEDRDYRGDVDVQSDGIEFTITTGIGDFCTLIAVVDVTVAGVRESGEKRHKCGQWHH